MGLCFFHDGPCWRKRDHAPSLFDTVLVVFVLEKTTGPTEISHLTSAFPLWSMLEKLGQVPNPFKIILILCILKEAKLVPNGFGIWPLLFRFYPCWKNMARIQTLFWNSFVLAHFERGQTGPKGVWNLIFVFPLWSIWKKCCQVPNPFWKHLGPFHFERNQTCPNGGLEPDLCFFPLWFMLKKRSQVPSPFKIILVLFILKEAKLVPNGFGTWPLLLHFGSCWEKGARFQTFAISCWPCSFRKGSDWSQTGLEPVLCFSTFIHVGKLGSGSNPVQNHCVVFHFESGQAGPKCVCNLASAFPLWTTLEKLGPGSKPF